MKINTIDELENTIDALEIKLMNQKIKKDVLQKE